MAGGKESPRQKMIGMMYLVLTALLALQVSSAIIQKFKFLDDSLMYVNGQTHEENTGFEKNIEKTVQTEGNKAEDLIVVKKAQEVRKETDKILERINKLRDRLILETGGKQEDGQYTGGKEETLIEVIMVGPEGSKGGEGYKLQAELNAYSAFLNKYGVKVPKFAMDGKEDPMFMKDKEQANKDFANLNFAQTPMVAALAVLAQKESEILKYENEVLSRLAQEVGASQIKFDHVEAMVRPKSKVVAAGTKYEAEMFITASSSTLKPTMKMSGSNLIVKDNKYGQVSFTAQGGGTPDKEGLIKKTWAGSITIKNKGKDTTFTVTEEYYVAQPVLQIQSASVSALYKNCGNELTVNCPALGSTYSPSFTASNATVLNGAKKGDVVIIPNAIAKVDLRVSSNGFYIGNQEFKVKPIPKPTIEARNGAKPINMKTGEIASSLRMISMAAVAEEGFKSFLPKDARFQVAQWQITLVQGKRPGGSKTFTSGSGDISSLAALAKPGDRYLIEVKKVSRRNFRDQVEDVAGMDNIMINIPLN